MGRILSRGCPTGPIHLLIPQFLCSTWLPVSSSRPTIEKSPRAQEPSRMARSATRQGTSLTAPSTTAHLSVVGDDEVRGELRVGARTLVRHPCMRRVKD